MNLHRNRIIDKLNSEHHYDQTESYGLQAYRANAKPKGNCNKPRKNTNPELGYKCTDPPNSKKPWYFLTKEQNIAIEQKRRKTKMSHNDYIESYINQKLRKWEKIHPKPCKDDDIFKEEFIPAWEAEYAKAKAAIVEKIHSTYGYTNVGVMVQTKDKDTEYIIRDGTFATARFGRHTPDTLNCNVPLKHHIATKLKTILTNAEHIYNGKVTALHLGPHTDTKRVIPSCVLKAA